MLVGFHPRRQHQQLKPGCDDGQRHNACRPDDDHPAHPFPPDAWGGIRRFSVLCV
ncbi:hypothetical protein CKO_01231 [Citrobacter koseri ATCC BAA-895]|uniref:Uncharacterized protein n=1 Tax=Citrobacter koseri (strain ATCC BAA-895 / CDC 4225-83 / SGSC4696) TaxID=290338 RepID=A8AFV8_CITK8|nr:hypothetical protein CKO_01231 [Citrobacter koseri ATCC BAA-895]